MNVLATVRRLVLGGTAVLVGVSAVGGLALTAVEDVPWLEGLWLAFSVVSTTGFGDGPVTSWGMVISMLLFLAAVAGYVLIATGAMVLARELHEPPPRGNQRPMLVERDVRSVVRDINRN